MYIDRNIQTRINNRSAVSSISVVPTISDSAVFQFPTTMGQRHQVFLIARVRPHGTSLNQPGKYRCIAALHHQWCYGSLPLRAMRRLVSLVSQPDNAAVIRAELRGIPEEYCTPDVPHPFTTTLMYSAWTTDLESESFYASRGSILEVSGGCWETGKPVPLSDGQQRTYFMTRLIRER